MRNVAIEGKLLPNKTVQALVDGRALIEVNGVLRTSNGETVKLQWQLDNVDISGATSLQYQVQANDIGHRLTLKVTATQDTVSVSDDFTLASTREISSDSRLVDLNNDMLSDLIYRNGNRLFLMTADETKTVPNQVLSDAKGSFLTMTLQNSEGSIIELPNADGTSISLENALNQGRVQLIDTNFGQQQKLLLIDKATDVLVEVDQTNGVATLLPSALYPENSMGSNAQNLQLISSSISDANRSTPDALLWQKEANGVVQLFINDAPLLGVDNQPLNLRAGAADWRVIATQDYTSDNRTDVLLELKDVNQHRLYMLQLDGSNKVVSQGYLGEGINIPDGWNIVSTEQDINGDQKPDLLFRNDTSGQVWEFALDGRNIIESRPITGTETSLRYDLVDVADVDANGRADLVLHDTQLGNTWIGLINSDGSIAYHDLGAFAGWEVKTANSDINGDARSELVYVDQTGNLGIVVLTPDATAIASAAPIGPYSGWTEISTLGVIQPEQMPIGLVGMM